MENPEIADFEDEKRNIEITPTASTKLIKNSKGYNWEIKILSNDIDEIIRLNNLLVEKYGKTD